MSRRTVKRLLALRTMEEECAEAEVSRRRGLRQACLNQLRASEERSANALRQLYSALHSGDRDVAISAEMALTFGPLERNALERQLSHLNPIVEAATTVWRNARICRMQIQSLADAAEARHQKTMEVREQKALDGWFLSAQLRRSEDENFQSKQESESPMAGTPRADGLVE
jgi:flagellar export protein FliJ